MKLRRSGDKLLCPSSPFVTIPKQNIIQGYLMTGPVGNGESRVFQDYVKRTVDIAGVEFQLIRQKEVM